MLVWLATDAGVEGLGSTYAGTVGGRVVQACVDTVLQPLIQGQDGRYTERLWERMYRESLLVGRRGGMLRAIAAVDIALWDAPGKLRGEPLYRLLGAHRDEVPAYASGGYYRPDIHPLKEFEGELGRYLECGFTDFKIKVGGLPLEEDRERVRVARQTIGPKARLALDANNAYNDVATALRAAAAFAPFDIWWFEEPTYPDSLPVAPHWHANLHARLVAAAPNGLTVEYFHLDEDIYNFERLIPPEHRLVVEHGRIRLPQHPGAGVVVDPREVERYRVG